MRPKDTANVIFQLNLRKRIIIVSTSGVGRGVSPRPQLQTGHATLKASSFPNVSWFPNGSLTHSLIFMEHVRCSLKSLSIVEPFRCSKRNILPPFAMWPVLPSRTTTEAPPPDRLFGEDGRYDISSFRSLRNHRLSIADILLGQVSLVPLLTLLLSFRSWRL
jgi:hypothetical protein